MGLSGNLRTMDLPEILQWISGGRKTGTLHVERGSIEKRLTFKDGAVFTTWSNDPRESLGQFLVRDGLITEEQLFRALLAQEREGRLLGEVLVAQGLLTDQDLRTVLGAKAEESVYDLFLWPDGSFEFRDGELPANVALHLETQVTALILEGIRRVDEWGRIRKVLPGPRTTFRRLAAPAGLDGAEARALELAAAGRTLGEMCLELRRTEFDTAELLYGLLQREAVAVDRAEEPTPSLDPVAVIHDLLGQARQRLAEKRYDAAREAYEQVLVQDRLNQDAKKGLVAVAEARERERVQRRVALDRVPVLAVSFQDLTRERFDPQEGFVLSRINGQWDVRSILKLCPLAEEDVLAIFARLLDRRVIELR